MTDLQAVKQVAKSLFNAVPLEPHPKFGAIVLSHPFTESGIVMLPSKGNSEPKMTDITENKEDFEEWKRWYFSRIDNAPSIHKIFTFVSKAYRLTFLKIAKPYIDKKEFSELFAEAWVSSENPNMDVNVSRKEAVKWFKEADKKHLMDKDEYKVWEDLPETFVVYRGVGHKRTPYGLSWTTHLETAEWFANRWGTNGYIEEATIEKKHALAYFNGRNEDEVVVDVFAIKNKITRHNG